jgi:hypothetical protein
MARRTRSSDGRPSSPSEEEEIPFVPIRQEQDPPRRRSLGPNSSTQRVIQEGDNESSDEDQTLEELLVKAQEAGARSRRAKFIEQQLERGLEILHSQGEEIDLQSDEILALNLTEAELKTLLRRYASQPQKVSLPGPSSALPANRLRLINNLKNYQEIFSNNI